MGAIKSLRLSIRVLQMTSIIKLGSQNYKHKRSGHNNFTRRIDEQVGIEKESGLRAWFK
jgi:hypothetical protein